MTTETLEDQAEQLDGGALAAVPGVIIVFALDAPRCVAVPLSGAELVLGRDELAAMSLPDPRVSRRHVRVARVDGRLEVSDSGSRNGTFVDGSRARLQAAAAPTLVRIGHTLLLVVGDVRPFAAGIQVSDGVIRGPALQRLHQRVAKVAQSGEPVLVRGASGSGKELAAKAFHQATGRAGPFVAINCATIPRELTERVLFGTRRGAYTGAAADAIGLVQSADGGTLFLDEIAELDTGVQAKLLRVLETHEVTPLGAVTPVRVDARVCAATHKNLREEVLAGRFREDLYFRIGRPELVVPELHQRREEIPWLIAAALAATPGAPLGATADFVEDCTMRRWPGNVRELLTEVKAAARTAREEGRAAVTPRDLEARAGRPLNAATPSPDAAPALAAAPAGPAELIASLEAEHGNISRAAARLGIARSRVRRLIERHGIDVEAMRRPATER